MPASDGDFLFRDGSALLNSAEGAGDGILLGPCPLDGMLFFIHFPLDATTVTIKFEESANNTDWTDLTTPPSETFTVGVATYIRRAFWTEDYVRCNVTACTGSFGYAQIGVVQGGEPNA